MGYSVSTGTKSFIIDVDDVEGGQINLRFNPNDPNIAVRFYEFGKTIDQKISELPQGEIPLDENGLPENKEVAERIEAIGELIKKSYDDIFGPGTGEEMFKYCHPMTISEGRPFAVKIGEVVARIVNDNNVEERKKYDKYLSKYKK